MCSFALPFFSLSLFSSSFPRPRFLVPVAACGGPLGFLHDGPVVGLFFRVGGMSGSGFAAGKLNCFYSFNFPGFFAFFFFCFFGPLAGEFRRVSASWQVLARRRENLPASSIFISNYLKRKFSCNAMTFTVYFDGGSNSQTFLLTPLFLLCKTNAKVPRSKPLILFAFFRFSVIVNHFS